MITIYNTIILVRSVFGFYFVPSFSVDSIDFFTAPQGNFGNLSSSPPPYALKLELNEKT